MHEEGTLGHFSFHGRSVLWRCSPDSKCSLLFLELHLPPVFLLAVGLAALGSGLPCSVTASQSLSTRSQSICWRQQWAPRGGRAPRNPQTWAFPGQEAPGGFPALDQDEAVKALKVMAGMGVPQCAPPSSREPLSNVQMLGRNSPRAEEGRSRGNRARTTGHGAQAWGAAWLLRGFLFLSLEREGWDEDPGTSSIGFS